MRCLIPKFICVLLTGTLISTSLCAQSALQTPNSPNNDIKHMTLGDGKIFMSGDFNWFGPLYKSNMAVFDSELTHDSSYPDVKYQVRASISDEAGGWYIASYGIIAHVKADKTIEELPFVFEGGGYPIRAFQKIGNTLYIGGQFTSINGIPRKYVAAIDLATNTLTNWNPDANGYVYCLEVSGSTVYVGGSFSAIGGQTRSKIAAIDATTGLATSWNANVTTSFGYVYTIAANATNVYFGGSFTNVASGSPARRNFASVNTTTGALTSFNPRPDDDVLVLLLDGNTLYTAGDFATIAGTARPGLAALDVTTGSLTAFAVTFNSNLYSNDDVFALAVDGQKLFVGGNFLTINGTERGRLAVVNKVTGALEPMADRAISDYILTISISDGKVLAGGDLRGISGISNSLGCVALDDVTGQTINWVPQIPNPPAGVYISDILLHYQDSRVYYRQDLSNDISILGAVNPTDGTAISTWSVTVNGVISAWAFSGDALYLAGEFSTVNGSSRSGFAAVDLETGAILPWTISYTPVYINDEEITSIAVSNNTLYAAGYFGFIDAGVERNNLAAWNAITGELLPWAPQIELGEYESADIGAVHNSKVYLFGDTALRVDAVTGEWDDWQPDYYYDPDGFEGGSGKGSILSMAIQDSFIYYAGYFSPGLARVNITTGERSGWQPDLYNVYESEGSVKVIVASETKLFAGGAFSYEADGVSRSGYAEYLVPDGPTAFIAEDLITTCSDLNASVSVEATGTDISYQWQKLNEDTGLFEDITDSGEYEGSTTSTLMVIASENSAGDYRCRILSYEGEQFSNVASLTVTEPCNQPPSITAQELATSIGGSITLDLVSVITTPSNNLDINSIQVVVSPPSGASVSVDDGVLTINYAGISFSGNESITIQACNINGNCTTQQFLIEVAGDIIVYNAVSPGGANPSLIIRFIELLPETERNSVTIYDRWQNEVWRGTDYDNDTIVFTGSSDNGSELPTGTYFYKIEFSSGRKSQTGFISLKR